MRYAFFQLNVLKWNADMIYYHLVLMPVSLTSIWRGVDLTKLKVADHGRVLRMDDFLFLSFLS